MKKIEHIPGFEDIGAKNIIENKDKEIERLNKGYCPIKEKCNKGECDCTNEEYNSMCEENIKLDLEIERLNNIINEIENMIVIKLQRDYHEHDYRINTGDLEEILDKLKELKGSDKE